MKTVTRISGRNVFFSDGSMCDIGRFPVRPVVGQRYVVGINDNGSIKTIVKA